MNKLKVFGELPASDYICLAFDVGRTCTGVAVGNSLMRTGKALDALAFSNFYPKDMTKIEQLITQWDAKLILVGEPIDTPNTAKKMQGFAKLVHKNTGLPTVLIDEGYSTVTAKQALGAKASKAKIDGYSALIILEQWFAYDV